ncbi:hypothetical protein LGM89_01065 [Burkholderia sp. AU31624]|uniref:hypothetical protein n=1 Tax=Burkholderia sp. AU31624 TaxID=2879629 RepID=UPI001CF378A0|nr:hypothetical protein [Burkholderia sp. AU31624]MCA8251842.1 hypothetical protein [Burkholderia sp. AU31624]
MPSRMRCGKRITPSNRFQPTTLEVRGDAGGWPLISLSTDEDGFSPVTTLGPTRDAMLDSIGRALSASGAAWRIDDA